MAIDAPGNPVQELPSEAEKRALLEQLLGVLGVMTRQELCEVVDRVCGSGTADAVLAERRRQADEARQLVQRQWEERYRDDPEGAARAEARVRRTMARIKAQTDEIEQARASRLTP
ncbi:hypothetical protein GCM10022419_106050 [Nonomuraea rosea]|uniref:Uncharacterized protein n=1 Tax=Nonomuraea rosea TaxID=638574 RepID=A0ABP6ZEX3_9ACTN